MEEFRKKILKVNSNRKHKIKNSFGVYDAYKWIRKNKWLDIGGPVTEHDFYFIIRSINKLLSERLINNLDIVLPYRMGSIELRKYKAVIKVKDGKIISNLPIDWDRTLKLWAEDKEAQEKKILVRVDDREFFKVFYNKKNANYNNKAFMLFEMNRGLKLQLKEKIKNKSIDAFC